MQHPSGDAKSLEVLIRRAGGGCAQAYNRLIQLSQQRLEMLAHRMLANYPHLRRWEETDDVMQNAAIRLQRALVDVQPRDVGQFFGLAAVQIRRVLIDLLRHHFGPLGDAANHESDVAPNGGTGKASAQTAKSDGPATLEEWLRFHQTVHNLSGRERQVVGLTWYAGLTQSQIASSLGVSVSTVRRAWHNARLQIYEAMEGTPPPV